MSKGIKGFNQSIGVSIGAFSIFGSLGTITADKIGGQFFNRNPVTVFYLCIGAYLILAISIVVLVLCRHLNT